MTTRVIFNTDKKLKEAAMRKAKREGLTYSTVLNFATRAYVENDFRVDLVGRLIDEGRRAVLEGRTVSQKELFRKLHL